MKQRKKYSNHRTKHKSNRRPNRRTKRKSNRRHNRRTNRRTNRRQIRKNMRGGMWERGTGRRRVEPAVPKAAATKVDCPKCNVQSWDGGARERELPGGSCEECRGQRAERCTACGHDLCKTCLHATPAPAAAPMLAALQQVCGMGFPEAAASAALAASGGSVEQAVESLLSQPQMAVVAPEPAPAAAPMLAALQQVCGMGFPEAAASAALAASDGSVEQAVWFLSQPQMAVVAPEPALEVGESVGVVTAPAPAPTPFQFTSYPSDTLRSLDKFYAVSPTDPNKYRLNIDKINLISCHGYVRKQYTRVPKGLTLYLFVPSGKNLQLNRTGGATPDAPEESRGGRPGLSHSLSLEYIRPYTEGGIIQEQDLYFDPVYKPIQKRGPEGTTVTSIPWRIRGLLKGFLPEDWRTMDISERGRALLSIPGSGDHFEKVMEGGPDSDPYNYMKHKDKYFKHNMDDIIAKVYLAKNAKKPIKLSFVLAKIAEARERDPSISADWFGGFCRLGDALNIETLKRCEVEGLPSLPPNFFDSDVSFEGASDELRRQSSLASKSETANFMNTVNELVEYSKTKDFPEIGGGKSLLTTIAGKLDSAKPTLEPDEVCFIFQMKQLIKEQEHL